MSYSFFLRDFLCALSTVFFFVKQYISVTDRYPPSLLCYNTLTFWFIPYSLLTKFHNTINVIQFNPYIRILFLNTVCTDVHKYNQCGLSTRISSWDFCNSLLYYALDCDVSPLQCDRIAMQFIVMQYNGYAILLRCKELHRIALFTMTLQKKNCVMVCCIDH